MSKMDDAIIAILEKRLELSQLTYADEKYDDIEEELHDLEDDFNDEYGTELENLLDSIHDQYCPAKIVKRDSIGFDDLCFHGGVVSF